MKFRAFSDLVFDMWRDCGDTGEPMPTYCLVGPPGIGKSSTAIAIADRMTSHVRLGKPNAPAAVCEYVCLADKLPEDIIGLPFPGEDSKGRPITQYRPVDWVHPCCEVGAYGLLVLDDITQATQAMQVAVRPVALERRVHKAYLAPGVGVIVTGNRREDKSAASTLPAHFRNAVTLIQIEPDLEEWCEWYGMQENCDPIIAAHLRWKPGSFSRLPKDADAQGAFATPREWHRLGRQFRVAQRRGSLMEVASGCVGEGDATEFCAFVATRSQLVDPEAVMRDPKGALPNPGIISGHPDKLVAMATALAEVAVRWGQSDDPKKSKGSVLRFLQAISWATSRDREFVAAGVNTFLSNGGNRTELVRTARKSADDELVKPLIVHLKAAFAQRGIKDEG